MTITTALSYGTVCSGIGAPELAATELGWHCSFMSEIEAFPRKVLTHRFPDHPLHGDFTTIKEGDYADINVLIGGTPCQDFSVAGKRLGMDAPRGNLALEYLALAVRLRPEWLVWENVPGILSSFSDDEVIDTRGIGVGTREVDVRQRNDFATFLEYLGECGYQCAWRILDGQHFGVPQRRRRIILVGHIRDWRAAAAVLFERESLQRDITPSRPARQSVTTSLAPSLRACGVGSERVGDTRGQDCLIPDVAGTLGARTGRSIGAQDAEPAHMIPSLANTLTAEGFDGSPTGDGRGYQVIPDVVGALDTECGGGKMTHQSLVNGHVMPVLVTLTSRMLNGLGARDVEEGALIPMVEANAYRVAGDGAVYDEGDRIAPLTTGTDRTANIIGASTDMPPAPVCFKIRGGCEGAGKGYLGQEDQAFTLSTLQDQHVFNPNQDGMGVSGDVAPTIGASEGGGNQGAVQTGMAVRRLTPTECERLMGFPDGWTMLPGTKPTPDGPRYKACGNSMIVPKMKWVLDRIQKVQTILNEGVTS